MESAATATFFVTMGKFDCRLNFHVGGFIWVIFRFFCEDNEHDYRLVSLCTSVPKRVELLKSMGMPPAFLIQIDRHTKTISDDLRAFIRVMCLPTGIYTSRNHRQNVLIAWFQTRSTSGCPKGNLQPSQSQTALWMPNSQNGVGIIWKSA